MSPEDVIDDRRLSTDEKRAALQDTNRQKLINLLIAEAIYGRSATLAALALGVLCSIQFVLRFIP